MKLATRISLFFLGTLAVVLLGMSVSIYALARSHLLHRVEARCDTAMDTIVASAEFDANGLEWESNIRHLEFENTPGDGPLLWSIFQTNGERIDGSPERGPRLSRDLDSMHDDQIAELVWKNETWHLLRRIVRSTPQIQAATTDSSSLPDSSSTETPNGDGAIKRYPALVIEVATPMEPALASLRNLAVSLTGISLAIWITSAIGGRYLCLKELSPLERMANAAGRISATDFSRRVPFPNTGNELDDLANALNDLLDRLQVSFEQQRRFAGEASHQLRTPLTAILGQLEVALRRDRPAPAYREALVSAHRQAGVLRQIVESLLFLTRERDDATYITLDHVDLNDWLRRHIDTWRLHPRFDDIGLECTAAIPVLVAMQEVLFAQALDNLLDNACNYSASHSPIAIIVTTKGDEARIEVRDQGCGIPENELPHIFDPFFRGFQSRHEGTSGVGLGLSVAKKIVDFFGGRIEVQSTVGKGSQIAIIISRVGQPAMRQEGVGV